MSDKRRTSSSAQADTKHSWWPGWIWAVPLAALAIGGWLLMRFLTQGGTDITITFTDVYGITAGDTTIEYRGMKVGSVDDVALTKDGGGVRVGATIQDSASKFLKAGTLFWLRGANPSLSNLSSLGGILSGPTIVMEPGPGKSTDHFHGLARKPALPRERGAPVFFAVSFQGSVGGLSPGDAVKLRGFPVGEVQGDSFPLRCEEWQNRNARVTSRFTRASFISKTRRASSPNDAFKAALNQLVSEGLRADLDRDPPLIGGYKVALKMIPGAPHTTMDIASNLPEIPTAPGGGLQSIVNRFQNVPIDQIAQNLLDITKHIDQIASSPKLTEAIAELDASLRDIHSTVQDVGPKVDQLVQALRNTSEQLEQAARSADKTMGGAASQTGLQDILREMKEAARSVRSLANYLERHPEALISGKPGD